MGQSPLSFVMQTINGAFRNGLAANDRSLLISESLPRYFPGTYGQNIPASGNAGASFSASNPTGVTSSAALAATYLGLCLSNPAGSTVLLVPKRVTILNIVAAAAETALGLITGWLAAGVTVHTTPITPTPNFVGAAAANGSALRAVPVGLVDSACTLVGTPTWNRWLSADPVATQLPTATHDLMGAIVIPAGGYMALGNLLASGASGFLGSIEWDEVPA